MNDNFLRKLILGFYVAGFVVSLFSYITHGFDSTAALVVAGFTALLLSYDDIGDYLFVGIMRTLIPNILLYTACITYILGQVLAYAWVQPSMPLLCWVLMAIFIASADRYRFHKSLEHFEKLSRTKLDENKF